MSDSPPLLENMDDVVCVPLERNTTYWFQPWNQGFCCWKAENNGRTRPAIFPYRMIDENNPDRLNEDLELLYSVAYGLNMTEPEPGHYSIGIDAGKIERSGEGGLPVKLVPLHKLVMSIPHDIRLLASQCAKGHYLALEAMHHVPEFSAFIKQEITGAGLSYMLTVWALGKAREQSRMFRLELARRMIITPRLKMLEMLTDEPCSHALLSFIEKIPLDELKPDAVWMAVDMMARPAMRQATGELGLITTEVLTELMKLPDWLVTPTILHILATPLQAGKSLESIIPPSLLTASKEMHTRLHKSFSSAKTLADLEKRIYQWADRLYYETSFPPAPLLGNEHLQPLHTGLMLRKEGRNMKNCVAGYIEEVVDGSYYFYAWKGKIRATIQLEHIVENRWILAEALGFENEELPQKEWIRIVESLAAAFGDKGLFLCRSSIAGGGYYDLEKAMSTLTDNSEIYLRRKPDNPHDPRAIEILTMDGLKLGHVPRAMNTDAACWMDAGLNVCAHFISKRGCMIELAVHATGEVN